MTPLEGNMAGASKPRTMDTKQQRSRRRVRDGALIHSGSRPVVVESGTGPLLAIWASGKRDKSGKRVESGKAGQVRYWQYGQAAKSPDLAISDLSRFAPFDSD